VNKLRRILLVSGALKPFGGFQTLFAYLAVRLQGQGVRASVLLKDPSPLPNQHYEALQKAGVVLCLPGQRIEAVAKLLGRAFASAITGARAVASTILGGERASKITPERFAHAITWRTRVWMERHFDLVTAMYTHLLRPQVVHVFRPDEVTAGAIRGARACRRPVVYSETGEALPGMAWYPAEIRNAVATVDLVLAIGERMARNARRLYGPGVDIEVFPPMLPELAPLPSPIPEPTVRLTYVGRLSPEKNVDGLIVALASLKDMQTSWRLRVVGDGPQRGALEDLSRRLGIENRVTFPGPYRDQAELREIAAKTDLFVLPSKTEGFGLVLLEAAAMCRPSLVTPVGAAGELVVDGRTGFVAADSTPEALAAALRRAFAERDRLPEMGRAARRLYEERYHPDRIFGKMLARYDELLRPRPAPAAETDKAALPDPRCDLSLVVVNYNMRPLVEEWLEHTSRHMRDSGLTYEILLGDTSTDPASALDDSTCRRWPNVRFHKVTGGSGWVAALNALLPQAGGRYACIIHPDSFMEPGCVRECVDYLERHPEVGVVAPNPVKSDGAPARARLRFPTLAGETRRLLNLLCHLLLRRRPLEEEPYWDRAGDARTETVLSFCYFCRREVILRALPITPRLDSWYANDYLCLAARRTGYRVMYLKAPRIVHHERRTPRRLYGRSSEMEYKASSIAGSPGMYRDRLEFIGSLYPIPVVTIIRLITAAEFCLRLAAALLRGGPERPKKVSAYARVLRIALQL